MRTIPSAAAARLPVELVPARHARYLEALRHAGPQGFEIKAPSTFHGWDEVLELPRGTTLAFFANGGRLK